MKLLYQGKVKKGEIYSRLLTRSKSQIQSHIAKTNYYYQKKYAHLKKDKSSKNEIRLLNNNPFIQNSFVDRKDNIVYLTNSNKTRGIYIPVKIYHQFFDINNPIKKAENMKIILEEKMMKTVFLKMFGLNYFRKIIDKTIS
jgi:hypothetical protein